MRETIALIRKELNSYFSSPMALIFVGVFLAITLFTFFWVEKFWARGLADMRPLFRWLPVLMIFLAGALTMRQWSEEEQSGTIELLLILPVRLVQLVIGKFVAVLVLIATALALTFFLPVMVSRLGNLDAGPAIGGYLAALLMAAAYVAIGLFVSSRTSNQIVALILTVVVCGVFHLVGTSQVTEFTTSSTAEVLRAVGTGSRFQSIERGVIDLRDLLYYTTLTALFLALNVFSLDSKRWGRGSSTQRYRLNTGAGMLLLAANLIVVNFILYPVTSLRADLTEYKEYSLSKVTKDLLQNLDEPLLITAYFSEENHPLLEPLIPRVRDTLEEYRIAAKGNLTLTIVDPISNSELETEANQIYGIRPTPVPIQGRTGSSILNIYFDILIRYGDQNVTLNFGDLIEVDQFGSGEIEVRLRNLEYDLTSAIKKVVSGFQSIDAVLESLADPAVLTLYVTPSTLPEALQEAPATIETIATALNSTGKFRFQTVNLEDPTVNISPQALFDRYQIRPLVADFLSTDSFYMHLVLEANGETQVIAPPQDASESGIRSVIEAALKRISTGFLTVVGVWSPPNTPQVNQFGQQVPSYQSYQYVPQYLQSNYDLRQIDLSTGEVAADIDVLLVLGPENLSDVQLYAIDQFLMRGGALFVAAGNYKLVPDEFTGSIAVQPMMGNLQPLLSSYGIEVERQLVLDPQNQPFPIPVTRNIGGFQVQEIQAVNYPHFVDVRPEGMDRNNPILANLPALTLNWVSPITLDSSQNEGRSISRLLRSTDKSWATSSLNVQPTEGLEYGFVVDSDQKRHTLGVAIRGKFESYFKDKPSPFEGTENPIPFSFIEESPDTARLIVVGSSEFLNDTLLQLSQSLSGDRYLSNLQFVQNSVDWAVQDTDLLSIQAGGKSVRLLKPIEEDEQRQWEIANYVIALLALLALGGLWRTLKRNEQPIDLPEVSYE